jgi:ferredoxin-NADP reductase/Na+-translocating ferredoxin:NAD+ oxidoreductase RnfD subunit
MYRLITWYLLALLFVAFLQNWRGALDYPWLAMIGTPAAAVAGCWVVNRIFASTFQVPVNSDSAVITGLILSLIVGPAMTRGDILFVAWTAALAMASKYVLAIRNVHLFNPAAIAVVITWLFAGQTASWWIGTGSMTPFVIAGGLILTRKLRRGDVIWSFLWSSLFVTLSWNAVNGIAFSHALHRGVWDSPVWFMAFAMLTEPVTLPSTVGWQVAYGVFAGVLSAPQAHIGTFYFSPELALVIANGIAIPFRSFERRKLVLDRVLSLGPGLADFLYMPTRRLAYAPGQYMEWTVDHDRADSRGKRRYFTLASSPTERAVRLGVKFAAHGSSYKQAMLADIQRGSTIVAAHVAGDFTLPADKNTKLAFIAGGIGVTPFRSMVKYLTDCRDDRDIVMLYANRRYNEILYGDVFQTAQRRLRFHAVLVVSDEASVPRNWPGEIGRIDSALISRQVPDFRDRLFYISGSPDFVANVRTSLHHLGIKGSRIKTDYFAGL